MTPQVLITMTGEIPVPPYQSVLWNVYNEPDNTGAQSGYGAGYLLNIGVDSITVLGNAVDPITLAVGGDLTGNLPDPYVSGLQGKPIATTVPTAGQALIWSGTAWTPSAVPASGAVGGDLTGSLPNPTVIGLQGRSVAAVAPSANQVLAWNGTRWIPTTLSPSGSVGGDLSGSLPNPTVTGLQGRAIDSTAPSANDLLGWNGTKWIPLYNVSVAPAASKIVLRDGSGNALLGTVASGFASYGGDITIDEADSFTISQTAASTNSAPNDIIISTQAPFASATGANRLPGDFIVNIPAAAGALAATTSGTAQFLFDGNPMITISQTLPASTGKINFDNGGSLTSDNGLDISSLNAMNITSDDQIIITSNKSGSGGGPGDPVFIHTPNGGITLQADNDIVYINSSVGITINDAGGGGLALESGGGSIVVDASDFSTNTGITFRASNGGAYNISVTGDGTVNGTGASLAIAGASDFGAGSTGGDIYIYAGTGIAHDGNISLGANAPTFGAGEKVIFLSKARVNPTTNPTNGILLYCDASTGALKARGSSGTVTTIAAP